MLSGMIAGGMTADEWVDAFLRERFENSYSDPANQEPGAASRIDVIPVSDRQKGTVGQKVEEPLAVLVTDIKGRPVVGAEVTFTVLAGGAHFEGAGTVLVTTGGNGIAQVSPTLGTVTKDNPSYLRVNQGDEYATQVGVNLFSATVTGRYGTLSAPKPFEVYGRPDAPDSMVKVIGDGNASMANNSAGTIKVLVVDQYQNPISNAPVTFQVESTTSRTPAIALPPDYRSITFYDNNECASEYPLYGECSSAAVFTRMSAHFGAGVYTFIGNTVNTRYEVSTNTPGVPSETFTLYSTGYWEEGNYIAPQLFVQHLIRINDQGEEVNAAKVGEKLKAPLVATLILMTSDYTMEGPTTCTKYDSKGESYQTDCWTIKGTGLISSERITDGNVDFTAVSGSGSVAATENLGDGSYQADYTTGSTPSLNLIEAVGEATVSVPRVYGSLYSGAIESGYTEETLPERTVTLQSGERGLFSRTTDEIIEYPLQKSEYEVYGVDVKTEVSPKTLFLGEGDVSQSNLTVFYSILPEGAAPEGYGAVSAQVDLSSSGLAGEENWEAYLVGSSVRGVGTAVFSYGREFDPLKGYSVQPVLNRGGDIEIRGDEVPLSFVSMGNSFQVGRIHLVSEFDSPVPGPIGGSYMDTYQSFTFEMPGAGTVSASILDENLQPQTVLVAETSLDAGEYSFVVDYEQVHAAGFDHTADPVFFVQLERRMAGRTEGHKILYAGRMSTRTTTAKMLGQTMVHDVLIQDGSLNLSRQDLQLKGRGPQLAFSRSYNNQNSPRGFKPLGRGWSHSLDMRLQVLSTDPNTSSPVPDWVSDLKGTFFTASDVPEEPKLPTVVQVNGTLFKKKNGVWFAERSKHGRLEEVSGGFVFTAKDGTRYRYDHPHGGDVLVGAVSDRNDNTMTFEYNEFGQLLKVTDAVGRSLDFHYKIFSGFFDDNHYRLISVNGPDGIELTFAYNDSGYLESARRGERIESYEYTREPGSKLGEYNLVKSTDSNGHGREFAYYGPFEVHPNLANFVRVLKSQDIVKQVIYPDQSTADFQYDVASDNQRIVNGLRGNDTIYTLNYFGNPTKIEEPLGKTTLMSWSIDEDKPDNVMTSRTDALGNTTTYAYDGKGNVTRETDPYGNSILTVWNQTYSLPESRTDRNGVVQTWYYDSTNGNLLWHEDGERKRTSYSYYATGELQKETDPLLNDTTFTYDNYGNPDTVSGAEGSVSDFDYDLRGRKTATTDPNGNRTEYAYNDLDYPTSITYPALTSYALPVGSSHVKTTIYDAEGNLTRETDRVGLTLDYTYTPRNQVETITRHSGAELFGVKSFAYDENGNLSSESDWKGIATAHSYDELNRRITTKNRLGDEMSMAYDLAGNLIQVTDFEGRVTDYRYDALNRQTSVIQPQLPGQGARGEVVTTYYNGADPETNVRTVTDAEGHTTTFEYNGRYQKAKRINALLDAYLWQYDDAGNLEREIDEEGGTTRYAYDRQNRRTFTYHTLGGREIPTELRYDAAGNVRYLVDPRGNITETTYDQWNRPWQTITPADPIAYTTTTERDGEGREARVTDGNGHARAFERDARGLVTKAIDAEQQPTSYAYDLNDNLEMVTNALGVQTRHSYDAEDRKLLTTDAEGLDEQHVSGVLEYDKVGNPLQVRDGNNNIVVTAYNGLNLPWKQYDQAPFNTQLVETLYSRNGQPISVRNRLGHVTTTSYDALGRVDTVTDPAPFNHQTIVTTYDAVGNVKTVKDKRGILSENIYDSLYRPVEQQRDGIRLLSNEYDAAGNVTATVDAENNRTEFAYNKRNLLVRTTYIDPDGVDYYSEQFYDGVGNLLESVNEEGEATTYSYDRENRQRTVTFAGETSENIYDELGNLVEVRKPMLNGSTMEYDGLNRLVKVTEGGLLVTEYSYDANGNLLSQLDPLGNLVEYSYDELNRKTAHIQHKPSGNLMVSYDQYDANGNLTRMTDAKGQVFNYAYDELKRLTTTTYPLVATPFLTIESVVTSYDANNNVATVTETKQISGGGTQTDVTSNVWDNFDRLDLTTQRGIDIDYGYDNNGNRTSVTTANGTTSYSFDHRNRLETAVVGNDITRYTYTPDGLTDSVTYPTGARAAYSYYPTNRVHTIVHANGGGTTFSSFTYRYDANGNRTRQVEYQAQSGVTETTDYVYRGLDSLDRLESFSVSDGVTTTRTDYSFEGYNRKTEKVSVDGVVTVDKTYSYDETNWLNSIVDAVSLELIGYQYDANGNTLLKSDSSKPGEDLVFTYDVANRLVETVQGGSSVGRYVYNAQGMRVRHYDSERGDVSYYYDDGAVLEEYLDGAMGGLLAHYRYGDRLLSLDAPDDGGVQYYHHDALGSTVNLTDSTGSAKVSYSLDPWGHIRNQVGTSVNRQIFTGQEHDENTGLIYFGARYYDPDSARFLSQDSYLGEPGTPPSLHRYLYAYSNPTVFVDLMGYLNLEKHQEAANRSLERALDNGSFSLPGNMANQAVFKEALKVGSMMPDLQNEGAAWGAYGYSLKEKLPDEIIERGYRQAREWVGMKVSSAVNYAMGKFTPGIYQTVESIKNSKEVKTIHDWWVDNSMIEPLVEGAMSEFPKLKRIDTIAKAYDSHFGDGQWQHGMGSGSPKDIHQFIIANTMTAVDSYNKAMLAGDYKQAGIIMGTALHYLEDTWTPSHSARNEDGVIEYFYDYAKQSPRLHGNEDNPDSDSRVMSNAVNAGERLIWAFQNLSGDSDALEKFLRKEIYPMNYNPDFKPKYEKRASTEDAKSVIRPHADRALNPIGTSFDEVESTLNGWGDDLKDYFKKLRE